jgi:5-methylthioadenosine/S-adenosylhomocysteine deaminase
MFQLLMMTMALLQAEPVDLVLRGGTVVTMDAGMRVLEGGSVAIRDDRIVSVLAAGEPLPEAAEVVDASHHLVIPGLVNSHGHVPMVLMRGVADDMKLMEWLNDFIFPAEHKNVDKEFVYWGTLLGGIEMALGGTTTFTDMYYFEEEIARATDHVGLRGVLGQTIIGFPAPDYATTDEALQDTEAFIRQYRNHPRVIPSVAPHALYTTDMEVIRAARELAKKYDVPFQMHAHESPQEDEAVQQKLGMTTVPALEKAGVLGPGVILHHVITLTQNDIGTLARYGVGVSHNPESNMKGASGLAPVPDLLAAGVHVGLGTDGPASNNNLDMFEEMDTAAKVHKLYREDPTVLPAPVVFRMATMGGAEALGLADEIGSLESGKLADIVLIDVDRPELTPLYDVYSQLVYVIKGPYVSSVLVGGKFVVRDHKVLTVDVEEVMAKARELQQKIAQSLGLVGVH